MAYFDDDDDRDGLYRTSSGLGAGGLRSYGNDDLYDGVGSLATRDYDTLGSIAGLGGIGGLGGLDDQLGGLSLNATALAGGLGSSDLYDSAYDSALTGDLNLPIASNTYLDGRSRRLLPQRAACLTRCQAGLDSYGSSRNVLGSSLDDSAGFSSGLGGLDQSGLGSYSGLDSSSYDSDLGTGLSSGLIDSGLDTLRGFSSTSLSGYDSLGGLGSSSLPGYDSLAALGSPGLPSYDTLSGVGSGLDGELGLGNTADGLSLSNYDYSFDSGLGLGSGLGNLDALGWSTSDSGLSSIGDFVGDFDASDILGGAALAAGGAALGAGAMSPHNKQHARGFMASGSLGYDTYGSSYGGGHNSGYGSGHHSGLGSIGGLYGDSLYDRDIGLLGHTSFGYGAYDGFGSGFGSAVRPG